MLTQPDERFEWLVHLGNLRGDPPAEPIPHREPCLQIHLARNVLRTELLADGGGYLLAVARSRQPLLQSSRVLPRLLIQVGASDARERFDEPSSEGGTEDALLIRLGSQPFPAFFGRPPVSLFPAAAFTQLAHLRRG